MKNFCFETICNITQEPQDLQTFNCAHGFISKFAVIKYHQLLTKVQCINGKSPFSQLATVSSSTSKIYWHLPQFKVTINLFLDTWYFAHYNVHRQTVSNHFQVSGNYLLNVVLILLLNSILFLLFRLVSIAAVYKC